MTDRATEGLDTGDWPELEQLIKEQNEFGWDDLDLAAAAIDLTFEHAEPEQPPEEVIAAVRARAREHFSTPRVIRDETEKREVPLTPWMGRLAYAAAVLIVCSAVVFVIADLDRGRAADPARERDTLLVESADLVRLDFKPLVEDPYGGVAGDVIWSSERQRGYLRLSGMPVNDASREQYQLWIVDPQRDDEPVDGGVFDVESAEGEVVIPIDAKLRVVDPAAFVITAEKPGGVVVSAGPHLILAARS
jgi:hypothetical protein